MSAPLSAYHSKALKDKTTSQNYLICKFLGEYTSIGTHFYLDKIAKYKDGSIFYFGGACVVGSENSKFHSLARIGKLFDGIELYTDGGLNTLGDCSLGNFILKYANLVMWNASFLSAYYVSSSNFGLKYKINSGSWITPASNNDLDGVVTSTLGEKGSYTDPLVLWVDAEKGDTITVKSYITNAEGTTESSESYITLIDKIIKILSKRGSTAQNAKDGDTTTLWMLVEDYNALASLTTSSQQSGLFAHTTAFRDVTASTGWYYGIDVKKIFYADDNGQFTKYELALDDENVPVGMPRMYKMIAFAQISDMSAIGTVTDSSSYSAVITLSIGSSTLNANIKITGMGSGSGRYANVYARRTNAQTPAVNEDIFVDTVYLENGVEINTSFSVPLSTDIIEYDKFTFLEII